MSLLSLLPQYVPVVLVALKHFCQLHHAVFGEVGGLAELFSSGLDPSKLTISAFTTTARTANGTRQQTDRATEGADSANGATKIAATPKVKGAVAVVRRSVRRSTRMSQRRTCRI